MTLSIHVFANKQEAQDMKDELKELGWSVEVKACSHVQLNDYQGDPKPKLIYDDFGDPLWVLVAQQ